MNANRALTVILGLYVALIATFLGFCTAYSDFRYNFRLKGPYLALILLPPTIPLIIMALAMLAWLSKIGMSGQLYSVIIAHSVLTAPFAMAVIRLRLNQMDPDLEAAAWNLGGSEWQTMRHVIIPFCKPAIASADRVIIMGKGEIAQIGTTKDIYRAPANQFVAEFVGRNNILAGKVASVDGATASIATPSGKFTVPTNEVRLTEGHNASFVISADLVHNSLAEPDGGNKAHCKLISEEFVGSMVTLFLEDAQGHEFKVQMQERQLSKFDLHSGDEIWLSWDTASAHVLNET